ncbi:MAG: autotransporter outer membrane beta-barrel domain-containing protein [Candidatus Omnitrophica bacterium]|nr:autotransporter outer membrane beta-barrel domain-containing protein [Candidatus Omnitrophota bacterium]
MLKYWHTQTQNGMKIKSLLLLVFLCIPATAFAALGKNTKSIAVKQALDQFEAQYYQVKPQCSSEINLAENEGLNQESEKNSQYAKSVEVYPTESLSASEIFFKKHTPQIGTEIYYFHYKESGVTEDGHMAGLAGSYAYHDNIMGKLEGRAAYGQLDYDGSGEIDDVDDYTWEGRGLVGYDFLIADAYALTPYLGGGYRYLNDDTSGMTSTTGAVGYERESRYIYSPVGLEAIRRLNNDWFLGASAEYDYLWRGTQISHLSDANSAYNDPENRQKKGYGIRGSLRLLKKGEKVNFLLESFIRYWNIKRSNDVDWTANGVLLGSVHEPKNNSTEVGVRLAVEF